MKAGSILAAQLNVSNQFSPLSDASTSFTAVPGHVELQQHHHQQLQMHHQQMSTSCGGKRVDKIEDRESVARNMSSNSLLSMMLVSLFLLFKTPKVIKL